MSEEIDNAAMNVPRAILMTMILNGATGFAMVLAVLFCLGDIQAVLVCFHGFLQNWPILTAYIENTNGVPFHPSILRCGPVQGWSHRDGMHPCCASLVCGDWVSGHRIAHDLVFCPRPRPAISSLH